MNTPHASFSVAAKWGRHWPKLVILLAIGTLVTLTLFHMPRRLSEDLPLDSTPLEPFGEEPLELQLQTEGRKMEPLSQYRGKVVVLNFWASWCAPCLTELPTFGRLFEKWRDRGFEVVAVNVDEEPPLEFIQNLWDHEKLAFRTYYDPNQLLIQKLQISVLPTSLILDRKGRVTFIIDGYTDWENSTTIRSLEELLTQEK